MDEKAGPMTYLFRNSILLSFAFSVGMLAAVFVFQYGLDLQPCVLCVYQRWPYAAVMVLALAAIMLAKKVGSTVFQYLIALSFAVTAGIGGFHVGVEQGWWEGTAECVADTSSTLSLDQLKAQIMSAPLAKCDEVAWQLFGISMAGYNMLFATVMALFMVVAVSYNRNAIAEK